MLAERECTRAPTVPILAISDRDTPSHCHGEALWPLPLWQGTPWLNAMHRQSLLSRSPAPCRPELLELYGLAFSLPPDSAFTIKVLTIADKQRSRFHLAPHLRRLSCSRKRHFISITDHDCQTLMTLDGSPKMQASSRALEVKKTPQWRLFIAGFGGVTVGQPLPHHCPRLDGSDGGDMSRAVQRLEDLHDSLAVDGRR